MIPVLTGGPSPENFASAGHTARLARPGGPGSNSAWPAGGRPRRLSGGMDGGCLWLLAEPRESCDLPARAHRGFVTSELLFGPSSCSLRGTRPGLEVTEDPGLPGETETEPQLLGGALDRHDRAKSSELWRARGAELGLSYQFPELSCICLSQGPWICCSCQRQAQSPAPAPSSGELCSPSPLSHNLLSKPMGFWLPNSLFLP